MSSLGVAFKALSDPTRREILRLLRSRDLTAGEIGSHFSISGPSISHHLSLLKQAELVLDERRGQHIVYSLNTTVVEDVIAWLLEVRSGESDRTPARPDAAPAELDRPIGRDDAATASEGGDEV